MMPMTDPGGGTPETLSVSGNNTKTISSGTYRLPNISISGNAKGEINGDVTLYLDVNTNISGNGIFNQNIAPRPEECVLFGTSSCTSVSVFRK